MKYIALLLLLIATQIRAQPYPKGDTEHLVDLGLRVRWAKSNLNSQELECSTNPGIYLKYNEASEIANEVSLYRLPTLADWEELINNCEIYYSENYYNTGVSGFLFTSQVPGYVGKQLFIPMSGYKMDNILADGNVYALIRLVTATPGHRNTHMVGHLSCKIFEFKPDYDKTGITTKHQNMVATHGNAADYLRIPIRLVSDYRNKIVVN